MPLKTTIRTDARLTLVLIGLTLLAWFVAGLLSPNSEVSSTTQLTGRLNQHAGYYYLTGEKIGRDPVYVQNSQIAVVRDGLAPHVGETVTVLGYRFQDGHDIYLQSVNGRELLSREAVLPKLTVTLETATNLFDSATTVQQQCLKDNLESGALMAVQTDRLGDLSTDAVDQVNECLRTLSEVQ